MWYIVRQTNLPRSWGKFGYHSKRIFGGSSWFLHIRSLTVGHQMAIHKRLEKKLTRNRLTQKLFMYDYITYICKLMWIRVIAHHCILRSLSVHLYTTWAFVLLVAYLGALWLDDYQMTWPSNCGSGISPIARYVIVLVFPIASCNLGGALQRLFSIQLLRSWC